MKIFATLGVAGLAAAAALVAPMAHAAPAKAAGVTATYGCSTATFTNKSSRTAVVTHGVASTGLNSTIKEVTVAPGKSQTVKIGALASKNFGWTARTTSGDTITDGPEYPGVNLTKYCPGKPTAKPTTKQTKPMTSTSGGLAKTGV